MPRKAKIDSATEAKAARMVAKLRQQYELGQQAVNSKLTTKQFAAQHGLYENTLRKLKAFARGYSLAQVEELVALRRPDGLPLHWGYIPYLLVIPDLKQRQQTAERVARHGWTAPELHAAIPKKYRGKHHHGRRMKEPATPEDGLRQLIAEAKALTRRCDVAMIKVRKGTKRAGFKQIAADAEVTLRELALHTATIADELRSAGSR